MFLEETAEQCQLRRELRLYYADLLARDGAPWREVVRQIGKDGWLGLGWPVEYGGQGRPMTDQFVFFDETRRAGAPFPFVTVNTVGPTIMRYGTEEQKQRFLPGILAGEIVFAIGYTEPEAGTDLAALRTRAVLDGDELVVDGAKIFTSGADVADHVWLACRTDPDAPKHQGISIVCVPTDAPGFSWNLITTVGGLTTTATYYDGVRVPAGNLVGPFNGGWRMITTQLNHERVGLAAWSGYATQLYDDVVAWARDTRMMDLPWVQADLARCQVELAAMRMLNWRMASATGDPDPARSSAVKVFGVERSIDVYRRLLGIVGAAGFVRGGHDLAARLEAAGRQAQINTFGGGVNEVQREIVATAGLGLRRA